MRLVLHCTAHYTQLLTMNKPSLVVSEGSLRYLHQQERHYKSDNGGLPPVSLSHIFTVESLPVDAIL